MHNLEEMLPKKFGKACDFGEIKLIKHIWESPSLKAHVIDDVKNNLSNYLSQAIKKNYEEVIDYLLAQKEIANEKIKIRDFFSNEFGDACYRNNLEKVKSLFFGKYKEHIDLSYCNYWCFRTAYKNNREEILTFLILDAGITRYTPDVNNSMNNDKSDYRDLCEKLFDKAVLKRKLEKDLAQKAAYGSKIKI